MKKLIILLSILTFTCCCEDDCTCEKDNSKIISSKSVFATIDSVTNYNGLLEIFPCIENTTIYQGNYYNGELMPFPAYYDVVNGIGVAVNNPLSETSGVYNLIYWGFPEYSKYYSPGTYIEEPAIRLGSNLNSLNFTLSKATSSSADTLYMPVYDIVHGMQSFDMSLQNLSVNLNRVTAGMNVIINNSNNTAFSTSVDSMWIYISGINYMINFATGKPANTSYKTVQKGISPTAGRLNFTTDSLYLFPSMPNPYIQLFVKLNTGTVKSFQSYLSNQLSAGTFTTLFISLNGILLQKNMTGNITIDSWVEQTDSITFPLL